MVVSGSGQDWPLGGHGRQAGRHSNRARFPREHRRVRAQQHRGHEVVDERSDLDAYVTWNIWYMPLRDRAKIVEVSDAYRIHRNCSVALTARGKAKPAAARFIEFLASPRGAAVFESCTGWLFRRTNRRSQSAGTSWLPAASTVTNGRAMWAPGWRMFASWPRDTAPWNGPGRFAHCCRRAR